VAARLEPVGRSDVAPNERRAALDAVVDVLAGAAGTDDVLLDADLDAATLARLIRDRSADRIARAGLSERAGRLFDVVLDECCVAFVQAVLSLGVLPSRTAPEILARLSGQSEVLAQVLARLPVRTLDAPAGTTADAEFRHRYLTLVSTQLDELELFGVHTRRYRPRASLSVAYISL
jgi:hypothetical protein